VNIEQNRLGPAILIANDPTTVTFGLSTAPAIVTINPDTGNNTTPPSQSIVLLNNSGQIRFNSSVIIGDSEENQIDIVNNTGLIGFGDVNVTNADSGAFATIVNIDSNTNVSFGSLSVTNEDSLSVGGFDNGILTFGGGVIDSDGGPAIDLVNNLQLNAVFDSVTAINYAPFPFGIRVLDNQTIDTDTGDVITNPDTLFQVRGSGITSSGGTISSGTTTAPGAVVRGGIFTNINTVSLNFQDYVDNEDIAILSTNTVNFTFNGGVVTGNNEEDTPNGTTDDPFGFHQILLRVTQDNTDVDTYTYTISNSIISDANEINTNDAMVQIETENSAENDTTLVVNLLDNQDPISLVPGFQSARDLTQGAAIRIDWDGSIVGTFQRNGWELAPNTNNQIGLDIIQNGTGFQNSILFSENTLVATGTTDDDHTGVRIDMDGRTDLAILNNAVVVQATGAITPGFVFAGTDATGFDLTLRSVGNTVVFDDNFLDFNNVGGTGLLFALTNTSDVRIGDDTGTFTNFGNVIELTDVDARFDRGIVFLTTFGTIGLSGTQDNIITTTPANGNGTFIPFQPPGSSVGQILINGVLQP